MTADTSLDEPRHPQPGDRVISLHPAGRRSVGRVIEPDATELAAADVGEVLVAWPTTAHGPLRQWTPARDLQVIGAG